MLAQRYQITVLLGLVALVSCYLLLPLGVSYLLANRLREHGYSNVILQLGYPGWTHMRIPVVSFQQDLGEEQLMVSLTDAEIRYDLSQLLQGRVSRIVLRDASIHVLTEQSTEPTAQDEEDTDRLDDAQSPWRLLTAGDLLRSLPILPFDELQLDHLTIFREQATGPLRRVTIDGSLTYSGRELDGHLAFRGRDTASYGLVVVGHSASTWSVTLAAQRPQAAPIVSWQSQADPNGSQIQVKGRLRINVQELAPFIALLVPIGPELERVTGEVAIDWAGIAAAEASISSLWEDERTHLDGNMRVNVTLPALKGVAKDIAVAYEGRFGGNATQAEWAMSPGVLLTATINTQPRIIPEAVRLILPYGDQPVRIENRKPVQGTLYWKETPIRTVAQGPLHVTYGRTPGPLVAQFETTRAEGLGNELVSAEGAYQLEGLLPKAITERLSAKEAMGGVQGTVKLARTHLRGVLLPPSSVTAKQIGQGPTLISSVTLNLSEPLAVECDLAAIHCSGGPMIATVRAPTMRISGRNIRVRQGVLRIQEAETTKTAWAAQGTLSVAGVSPEPGSWWPSTSDWAVKFSADQGGIKADLRVDTPTHEGFVTASIEQPLQTAQGVMHGVIGPLTFNGNDRRLSKMIMGLSPSTDLIDGMFTATVDASWASSFHDRITAMNRVSATAKVVAEKLSGYYGDYVVKGLSTTMVLYTQGLESIVMTRPALIFVAAVQSGVDVANLAASYQIKWKSADDLPIVDVRDFQCEAFGGTISSPGSVVDLAKPQATTTFSLQNLDLAKILSVEQQKGLQGTGTLNGTLPVMITSGGIIVKDGVIEAQPPGGTIRYASTPESTKTFSESDQQLQLVAQALNNFQYSLLRVGVKYGETGMLDLNARLEGRNPNLRDTPPIHFNLTVQEHIPTLLKSLRLVEDIHGTIERKYRRQGPL
ncbi:MAG: YdbH domain-containing protein [Nitrospira sp.]|nr:YdbH domain-containing protein [Nitrospira sp.]